MVGLRILYFYYDIITQYQNHVIDTYLVVNNLTVSNRCVGRPALHDYSLGVIIGWEWGRIGVIIGREAQR